MSIEPLESNRWVFDFLRNRAAFVESHAGIESVVLWGAVVDAITVLHAARLARSRRPQWKCFQTGLIDLVHFVDLRTVSVPLLRQELHQIVQTGDCEARALFEAVFRHVDAGLAPDGMIWTTVSDKSWQPKIAAATTAVSSKRLRKLVESATYAGILYSDYRCPLVHGLTLGWRTWPGVETPDSTLRDDVPTYMNYLYSEADPRPARHRGRIRISFNKLFLIRALHDMIEHEERESSTQGWIVPGYATLE
jgi:hypothetical protein